MPEVSVAEYAGFCQGVKRAVDLALSALDKQSKVYTLGPIVHNEVVVACLEAKGVEVIETVEDVEEGIVVIRSHGVSLSVYEEIDRREELSYIDATCPLVRHVQKMAGSMADDGYQVLISGDPSHPEVVGILGWAGSDAHVITKVCDFERIKVKKRSVFLSQTTQMEELFEESALEFKKINPEGLIKKTICRAAFLRQRAARELALKVELMIVVGGTKSSNTKKLTQICSELVATYQVVSAEEISLEWFKGIKAAGVTAGASTPDWMIKEVVEKMEMEKMETENEMENENEKEQMGAENDQNCESKEDVKLVQVGDLVEGKIIQISEDIIIDIADKVDAVLPRDEIYLEPEQDLQDAFKLGDMITVIITKKEEDEIIVSKKSVDHEKQWDKLEEALNSKETLKGKVKDIISAGITIDLGYGIAGFMPGSLVDIRYIPDFQQFAGEELSFKVIELDRDRGKIILSRKQVIEKETEACKEALLKQIKKGDIMPGIVRRLTDFGAFVDIGGIDGLAHISELSWERVEHPKNVLREGEEIKVKVLEVIPEKERVSLSIRQTLPDPWTKVSENLKAEEIVRGKVTRIVNFGAFVEILPGVEGLVHISQMADYHVKQPSEIVTEGEEIEVKILDLNQKAKRISLSIKDAQTSNYHNPGAGNNQNNGGNDSQGVTLGDVFSDLFKQNREEQEKNEN